MTGRPSILLATDSLEPSGVGEHMLALAAAIAGECDITLAVPLAASGDVLGRAAANGHAVQGIGDDAHAPFAAPKFDLAHIHAGIGWEGHGLSRAAVDAGVPVIVRTEHLPYVLTDPDQIAEHRDAVGSLHALICVSDASRESYYAAGIARDSIDVVRNGVAPRSPRCERAETRAKLDLAQDARLAIVVARLSPQKNHAALIAAMPAVLARCPQLVLAFAGDGPLDEPLRASAAPFGPAIRFLGARDDVPDLLAAADLFVLPSLFEGLPLSLIEAMAAGLPIVASEIGGIDEVVESGVTGLLVPPDRLAGALIALLLDRERAAAMGRAGRQRFETLFASARMGCETLAVYRRAGLAI